MNFRQVRKKIKTISNVKKITKAMQMVSAVKMKKSQERALEGKLYKDTLFSILQEVTKNRDIPLLSRNEDTDVDKKLYIVVGAQKGLCGSYHMNMVKYLFKNINFDNSSFIVIGNKLVQFLIKMRANVIADYSETMPLVDSVSSILSLAMNGYKKGEFHSVSLVYTRFMSTFKFEPYERLFLPLEKNDIDQGCFSENRNASENKYIEYLIEPSPEELLESLVRDVLLDMLRTAIYDSEASEHSARMMAMKNATDNAENIIFNLTLLRNKLRQEGITNELLDMISAISV